MSDQRADEPEGVGEGAEYEIAEQDEQEEDARADGSHPDRTPVRGNPPSSHSDVAGGLDKLDDVSGN